MEAESAPMVITGSAVVAPIRLAQGRFTSSVSSAMISPQKGRYQVETAAGSAEKPIRLPKDMFITASATLCSTAQAAFTRP